MANRPNAILRMELLEARALMNAVPDVIFSISGTAEEANGFGITTRFTRDSFSQLGDTIPVTTRSVSFNYSMPTGPYQGNATVTAQAADGVVTATSSTTARFDHRGGLTTIENTIGTRLSISAYVLGGANTPYSLEVSAPSRSAVNWTRSAPGESYGGARFESRGLLSPGVAYTDTPGASPASLNITGQSRSETVEFQGQLYSLISPTSFSVTTDASAGVRINSLLAPAIMGGAADYTLILRAATSPRDITVSNARYDDRNATTLAFDYRTAGRFAKTSFSVYQSADKTFDPDGRDDLINTTIVDLSNDNPISAGKTVKITNLAKPNKDKPYLLIVADSKSQFRELNETNNSTWIPLPLVEVSVDNTPKTVTLPFTVYADVTPQGDVGTPKIEATTKYPTSDEASWEEIGQGRSTKFTPRLVDNTRFRAYVEVGTARFYSKVATTFIQFPLVDDIAKDRTVLASMRHLWLETLDFAFRNKGVSMPRNSSSARMFPLSLRREFGFMIYLDTGTPSQYVIGTRVAGPPVSPDTNGRVRLLPNIDILSQDSKSAIYTVATFHTHTPVKYKGWADGSDVTRETGPSGDDSFSQDQGDVPNANLRQTPGLVWDYYGSKRILTPEGTNPPDGELREIASSDPLTSSSGIWPYGPIRRFSLPNYTDRRLS